MLNAKNDVVLSAWVDLSSATSATAFQNQPQCLGLGYEVIDAGFTCTSANSGAASGVINIGTKADPDGIVDDAKVPETFPAGRIISSRHRVAEHVSSYPFTLAAALKNSDGRIFFNAETVLVYAVSSNASALGEGFVWVRLRPLRSSSADDYQI